MIRIACANLLAFGKVGLSFLHHSHLQSRQRSAAAVKTAGAAIPVVRLYSTSLEFSDDDSSKDVSNNIYSAEDLARWEQMYQDGAAAAVSATMKRSDDQADYNMIEQEIPQSTEIRVVTFDLDNTLWKTGNTIGAANDVLNNHLTAQNITVTRRIEKIMGDLFQANRTKYCPKCDDSDADKNHEECCKSPVLLTQLRTDAIAHVLQTENGFASDQAIATAQEIFEIWAQARHDAILDNLAPNVIETLQSIRSNLPSSKDGTPVVMGAITDGNSNPGRVEVLRPYFDFVVNAESVGVAKPDKQVYLEAVRVIATKHDTFSDLTNDSSMEELEDLIGPYWVHIGDDFIKDIVAAKNLKMRTIWAVELVKHKLLAASSTSNDQSGTPTMEMEEFLKKVSSESVVSLGIGADDYLASSVTSEFVDAVAEGFSDIGRILVEWHSESTPKADLASSDNENVNGGSSVFTNAKQVMPPVAAVVNEQSESGVDLVVAKAFRIIREDCSIDVPAPLKNRSSQTMKEIMSMAQLDKSSGVFAFSPEDGAALQAGTKTLMIGIGGTDLRFNKDIFAAMTVEEVLSLTQENPVVLEFTLKEAAAQEPTIDLF